MKIRTLDDLFQISPYSLNKGKKDVIMLSLLKELTEYHICNCKLYCNMMKTIGISTNKIHKLDDIPFIPSSIFKYCKLTSVKDESLYRTMKSSGTRGTAVSQIYIDRETSVLQMRALTYIMSDFIGDQRLPILFIDSQVMQGTNAGFSGREAGIRGFSILGKNPVYALDENMNIRWNVIAEFIEQNRKRNFLMFGYTYIVWEYFLRAIKEYDKCIDLSGGILIHGGGWKKLESRHITEAYLKEELRRTCNITKVYDYYGMVEQTGSVYMQCECGYLHASNFSDIIIREPKTFKVCGIGEKGIIQTFSVLPHSYPGHSLLTEDEGILFGEDNCVCGRMGKYFKVLGRLPNSEMRGCGNTYEDGRE